MSVPLLDLKAQHATIAEDVMAAIGRVVASQAFILGPEVAACEAEIAAYCGARHGVGVSSGTDALLAALMALDIGPGDEIITSPFTFFATAGAIARLGAVPVFVDIEPDSFNIDPAGIEAAITPRSRAIVPVHLYGQCADMDPILDLAARHRLAVIEDAAQAIGAGYKGRSAGSMGAMGCFSFFPSKNLGACGDGGMVVTNDDALAERLRVLRAHGSKPKYFHAMVGGNFRLDALQAAVVRAKLPHLAGWTEARRRNARLYDRLLAGLPGLTTPPVRFEPHVFNQYVIRVPERGRVQAALGARGIGTEIYYPLPLHRQECFAALGHGPGSLPHSELAAEQVLALPIYPELSEAQIAEVAAALKDAVGAAASP
ncbi:DegT/DnrJ/EryC1/StrS aminotransferase family protein [Magnetospirillum sp. SS-4]|uniref:DegT/DnrJ/EryC1/StrS family aminotransferase n=1 Tax=Magnetospirillum sp. SS-4 TaxID=2681465 RepID=UPI00137F2F5E|nr:DegT/DnrJ/EryC1/StrS family aminotransferase [Magnetospirillum sp. SS-4]CAA7622906.1 Pleiotropic regulatory protein [Magnetospirillum sp. SS-4]